MFFVLFILDLIISNTIRKIVNNDNYLTFLTTTLKISPTRISEKLPNLEKKNDLNHKIKNNYCKKITNKMFKSLFKF